MAHGFPTMIAIRRFRDAQRLKRGCRLKALPKRPPRFHPQTWFEQATIFTATIGIQGLKVKFLVLAGVALLVASCKSKKCPGLIYFGAPLGLHNPNVKFTVNKCRKDDLILDYLIPSTQIVHSLI